MTELNDSIRDTAGIEWLAVGFTLAVVALLLAGKVESAVEILALAATGSMVIGLLYAIEDFYHLIFGTEDSENDD